MPLLNIVAQSCSRTTILVASVFLPQELQENYEWALRQLLAHLGSDAVLTVLVTDRELALINAIRIVYPTTVNLLCIWHIEKNVVSHCKGYLGARGINEGPTPQREPGQPATTLYERFMDAWHDVIRSETEAEYQENMSALQALRGDTVVENQQLDTARNYVLGTWLTDHKERFVAAWANRHRHFGMLSTSMAEGSHSAFKKRLKSSTGDMLCVVRRLRATYRHMERLFTKRVEDDDKLRAIHDGALLTLTSVRVGRHCAFGLTHAHSCRVWCRATPSSTSSRE